MDKVVKIENNISLPGISGSLNIRAIKLVRSQGT